MKTQVKEQNVGNLSNDLSELMVNVAKIAQEKKYLIKIDGEEQDHLEFLKFNIDGLTKTAKKKVSKKVNHLLKKSGNKSLSNFFRDMKFRKIIELDIVVDVCEKEKQIQERRKEFVKLRNSLEQARLSYLAEKGDFYGKKV